MESKSPITILKECNLPIGPGKLLPFINLEFPGQLFRWQGDTGSATRMLIRAEKILIGCGFRVERVSSSADILHVH